LGERTGGPALSTVQAAIDESQNTWGLQATKVVQSRFSGRGIKVAVLDTGLDLQHPDFSGRHITAASFVPGETPQDGHDPASSKPMCHGLALVQHDKSGVGH
jgi:subtilisin family serine protease